jgi:hypothetical protein
MIFNSSSIHFFRSEGGIRTLDFLHVTQEPLTARLPHFIQFPINSILVFSLLLVLGRYHRK